MVRKGVSLLFEMDQGAVPVVRAGHSRVQRRRRVPGSFATCVATVMATKQKPRLQL